MIKSFSCKETEKVWNNTFSKKLPFDIQTVGLRKLRLIEAADRGGSGTQRSSHPSWQQA